MNRVNFDFPKEKYKKVKMMCLDIDISIKELMSTLLEDALEEYENKKNNVVQPEVDTSTRRTLLGFKRRKKN